ncbi:hypothetical protein CG399_08050 [Bifidobacteriaceae bacterium NR015]|nr:hypothetical protein CG399_08050 [Bifidobacteriaceae bacterium NR015]
MLRYGLKKTRKRVIALDIAGAGAQDTQAIPAPTSISSEEIGNKFIVSVCDNIVTCFVKYARYFLREPF